MAELKLRYVGNAPFFSTLTEEEQTRISERMHLEHRRSGETLFQQDADSTALYLIKSGWVRLVTNGGTAIASQGPGSLVGETDLFLDRPRTHGAIFATDAEVWVLDKADVVELIADSPQLGVRLSLAFGGRLALFDQYLVDNQLTSLPFLSGLDKETLRAVAGRLVPVEKSKDEIVVQAGQDPEALFLIESGQLHLLSSEEGGDFSELGPGESFGEMAVLTGKPHARTAQAATNLILWALPAVEFDALAEHYPEIRMALSQTIREPLLAQDQERAVERLATMPLFGDLSEEVQWAVSERLLLHHVPAGEYVFVKGGPGDALYLIEDGQVEILSEDRTGRVVDARLGPDEFFGEMALLTGKPRTTSARTKSHTNLWVLYRSDFDDLVNRHPAISLALSRVLSERLNALDRRFADDHLRGLKLLAGLSSSQINDISKRLKPVRFRQGEWIIREGDPGEEMFFIESGRVQVIRGHGPEAYVLDEMGAGELFGEMALLTNSPRSATVLALSDLDAWVVSKVDFDDLVTAYPTLAMALSRLLSERLRNAAQRPVTQTATAAPATATTAVVATAASVAAPTQPTPVPKPPPQPTRQPSPVPQTKPSKTKAAPKSRRSVVDEVGQAFSGVTSWFGSLSRGAKVRLVLFTMILAWLFLIVVPVVVIQTLAADDVTNLQGAIAFVKTTTPLPTDAPPATDTAVPVVFEAEALPVAPETGGPVPVEAPQAQQVSADQVPQPQVAAPVEVSESEQAAAVAPVASVEAGQPAESVAEQPPATATPWIIVITNTPAPATDTPIPPTATPIPPTAVPTSVAVRSVAAKPPPTATPAEKPQPARELDPRLPSLGVGVEPAGVRQGQSYWRLILVRWANEAEAGGGHSIFINVLDENGSRLLRQPVEIQWVGGGLTVQTEDKPPPEFSANFPMYNTLGSYAVSVAGLPSDRVVGLGLGTAEQPAFTIHTNFFLTFQRVTR
jgi:CRP-like cAMP-binding protein